MKNFIKLLLIATLYLVLNACSGESAENLQINEPQTPSEEEPQTTSEEEPQEEQQTENQSVYFTLPYEFSATDIYGNTVNENTLGEKRIFFIHYWATWCGPCINEMPDLAKLSQYYAESVGFIGLINDFDSNSEGALNIIELSGAPSNKLCL